MFWTLMKSVKFLDISKDAQSFLPSASVFILLSCSWYSFLLSIFRETDSPMPVNRCLETSPKK